MQVVKIGGNEIADPGFRSDLAATIAALSEEVVVVHGGGKSIAEMQGRLGLKPVMVDGLRVTDGAALEVAQMVLSGQTNKLLVAALLNQGVQALGISGVDGGLLRCQKKKHPRVDLGLVGEIVEVEVGLLRALLKAGIIPVVSPISLGVDGQIYNVNADEVAGAIGVALQARTVSFISNVAAVFDEAGNPLTRLTSQQTQELIEGGVIRDGMVPKVQSALNVVSQGVAEARILNLAGLQSENGTTFTALRSRQRNNEPQM